MFAVFYFKELEKMNADLTSRLGELESQAAEAKAKSASAEQQASDESHDDLRAKIKDAKELLESLKIENELTKKTLALMSI